MKRINVFIPIAFFILIGLSGCEDRYASGPEIAWTSGTITYSYSGGAISGFNAIVHFAVVDDRSGDVKITATHGGETKSSIASVEPGQDYRVRVVCPISSQGAIGSILIDSPSAEEPFTVSNNHYKVIVGSIAVE